MLRETSAAFSILPGAACVHSYLVVFDHADRLLVRTLDTAQECGWLAVIEGRATPAFSCHPAASRSR